MDRTAKLLAGLDPAGGLGLEIGALTKPVLRRPRHRVLYADHADTETLRAKYAGDANVSQADILPVDVVWNPGTPLHQAVGGKCFDHVVASHVIEHAPNLVAWLDEIRAVLRPFGSLRLAIPDKRYCFDFLRPETGLADVLESHLLQRTRPAAQDILEFWGYHRNVPADAAWRGEYPADRSFHVFEMPAALQRCRESADGTAYHDVHCWVFTPQSFATIMEGLGELGLLGFACNGIHRTAPGELEFFVHLMRMEEPEKIAGSWRWAAWSVLQP